MGTLTGSDQHVFMRRALDLAWESCGSVGTRPPVGAVVVRDNQIVGEGKTQPRPGNHAEGIAINTAKSKAKSATLFCTLEPHSFYSSVPPCTEIIVKSGIKRVVSLVRDPNPAVNGNGFKYLINAGIEVEIISDSEYIQEGNELLEGFRKHLRGGLPFVSVKVAMSTDGKVATTTGESKWITSQESRKLVHLMRSRADVVLTGIGSILKDNSRLTARLSAFGAVRPLVRAVIDSNAQLPPNAALLSEGSKILWFTGKHISLTKYRANLQHIQIPQKANQLDLTAVMQYLKKSGYTRVMVEAGPRLLGSLFDEDLVDKLDIFIAPLLIGGKDAPSPIGGLGISELAQAKRLNIIKHQIVGQDILVSAYVS